MYVWECMIGTEYAALQEGRMFCVVETVVAHGNPMGIDKAIRFVTHIIRGKVLYDKTMCEELEVLQCIHVSSRRHEYTILSSQSQWRFFGRRQLGLCHKWGGGATRHFTGIKKNHGCGPYAGSGEQTATNFWGGGKGGKVVMGMSGGFGGAINVNRHQHLRVERERLSVKMCGDAEESRAGAALNWSQRKQRNRPRRRGAHKGNGKDAE
ncbi:hypothetical protein BKA62DRAFT_680354, partial [Auriculariales sp. MPI-PUGE-AT-0066]